MSGNNSGERVCIMLPVQNNENTVAPTLNSLLKQTYSNFKILVVDDGSVDNTPRVLKKFTDDRIYILRFKKSIGLVHALNLAISEIDEELIIMANPGTISGTQRVEKLVDFMNANADVGVCGSKISGGEDKIPLSNDDIVASLLFCNAIDHDTIIMRSAILEEKGFRYRDKYPGMADYDLWFRLINHTRFANLDEELVQKQTEHPHDFNFHYSRTEAASFFVEKLTKIGLQLAEKELLVHLDLCNLDKVKRFSGPTRYKNWIDKLVQFNKKTNYFPHHSLVQILAEKWKSLYPYMLNQDASRITDYMKIEGHSQLEIIKFLLRRKLRNLLQFK